MSLSGLAEPFIYQFLDSNGDPLDLGSRFVALGVTQLTPVEREWFYANSPVVQKISSKLGKVRINFTETPISHLAPFIIEDPGSYRLVVWAYTIEEADQTPATYDVGCYDSAQYDEDVIA